MEILDLLQETQKCNVEAEAYAQVPDAARRAAAAPGEERAAGPRVPPHLPHHPPPGATEELCPLHAASAVQSLLLGADQDFLTCKQFLEISQMLSSAGV